MKAIVVYKSVSGYTKKYARYIADELGADLLDYRKARANVFSGYDLIIFGGSIHAVKISGIGIIRRNLSALAGKKIIVFATGALPDRKEISDELMKANFPGDLSIDLRIFYLRGGFDFNRLGFLTKIALALLRRRLRNRERAKISSMGRGMLAAADLGLFSPDAKPLDFTMKEAIMPLVEWVREGGS